MKKKYIQPATEAVRIGISQMVAQSFKGGGSGINVGGKDDDDEDNRVKSDWSDIWDE